MDSLPKELIEEILYRLPVVTVFQLKSTCKKLQDLIEDKRFAYDHHKRYREQQFIRIENNLLPSELQILDPVSNKLSDRPMPMEFQGDSIEKMVHCDGLMLCVSFGNNGGFNCKKALLNPVSGNVKSIEQGNYFAGTDYFGIGYDNECRGNYKILRIPGIWSNHRHGESEKKCEIYEVLKSNQWRKIRDVFPDSVDSECVGVSAVGNMYWISLKDKKAKPDLVRFDFSTESFKTVCVCPTKNKDLMGCFNGDRLSLLQQEETRTIHVWLTNKLSDRHVEFSKYFDVVNPRVPRLRPENGMNRPGYFIGENKNIIVWCELIEEDEEEANEEEEEEDDEGNTLVALFNIHQDWVIREIETGRFFNFDDSYRPRTCSYVFDPSLITFPEIKR